MDAFRIVEADLGDPVHRVAVLEMTRVNIHDLHVIATHQRRGLGRCLLEAIEAKDRALDCAKLTLEVQEHHYPALAPYAGLGFREGQYEAEAGRVLFREKRL